jgi:hypothetical protein
MSAHAFILRHLDIFEIGSNIVGDLVWRMWAIKTEVSTKKKVCSAMPHPIFGENLQ